uniref:Bardet-Biedl syndrome 7 protein homolog n=1 Tax=Syphacia muris TaxID=451379 RepID=A0A0N5AHG3_9BILA
MDISLARQDYVNVGSIAKGCMKLIPIDNKKKKKTINSLNKIVTASNSGYLQCFDLSEGEPKLAFKAVIGKAINCLEMGGALGTVQDKIYVATENCVKGFSKKGKQFFSFETAFAEPLQSMYVYGVDLLLCGTFCFSHFHNDEEVSNYLSEEKINDVLCLPVVEGSWFGRGITPVLAIDDKTIKVLSGSQVAYEVCVRDQPNILHLFMNDGGSNKEQVLYGCRGGQFGLVNLMKDSGTIVWELNTETFAAITSIDCYSITGGDRPDLIIGKEDGYLEIYTVDDNDIATFKKCYQCGEGIISVQCGRVASNYDEIITCSHSGNISSLTTAPLIKRASASESPKVEVRMHQLKSEVEELKKRVVDEKKRYLQEVKSRGGNSVCVIPTFAVQDHFVLDKQHGCYVLSLELLIPIDYVLLQSDVYIELDDVDRGSAVISQTTPDKTSGNAMLATFRCQMNTTRMEIKLKSAEGRYGTIQTYVCPKMEPKVCQVCSYNVKPLSLHHRVHDFDASRPYNEIKITGTFSITEAHQWINLLLNEVPQKVPANEVVCLNYAAFYQGLTQLQVSYGYNIVQFRSDSVSTIAIIRDVLSKEITKQQIKVDIQCDRNEQTIVHCLKLYHPILQELTHLSKDLELSLALKELVDNGTDLCYLTDELQRILDNYYKLHEESIKKEPILSRITGIIVDLYMEICTFGEKMHFDIPIP